jgi:hypothetical protein
MGRSCCCCFAFSTPFDIVTALRAHRPALYSTLLSPALAKIDHIKNSISRVGYQVKLVFAHSFTSFFCFFFFVCLSCCIAGCFGRSLARNNGNMAPNGGCGLGCIIRRMRTIAGSKDQEYATAFFTHCSAPLVVYAVHLNGIEGGYPTGGRARDGIYPVISSQIVADTCEYREIQSSFVVLYVTRCLERKLTQKTLHFTQASELFNRAQSYLISLFAYSAFGIIS